MSKFIEKPAAPRLGWFGRRKVNKLLDEPEQEASPKLAKFGASALPILLEAIERGDPRSAKAAYLIGKLAEAGVDCSDALHPLFGLLQNGNEMEKGMAAVALARMWIQESVSMLIAGLGDKNNKTRLYSAMGLGMAPEANPLIGKALRRVAESDWDPKVREQAQRSLAQNAQRLG